MNDGRSTGARLREVAAATLGGLAIGVLQYGVAVSLSALVFAGSLSPGAGRGAAAFIVGTMVAAVIVGLFTHMSVSIAGAQDTAAIVVAAVAASIASTAGLTEEVKVATVFVTLALSAAATGLGMWLIGRFDLSSIVRYLPDPVVSGFVAGTGWLLFRGGVEVALGRVLSLGQVFDLADWDQLRFLLPALALGAFMVVCIASRFNNAFVSVAILGGAIAFHLIGRAWSSLPVLEADGWLIGPFPAGSGWSPIRPSDFAAADWATIAANALPIVAIVGVSIVGFLLNLGGLEPILDEEIDMDHELTVSAPVNVVVAAAGGLISYPLLGSTTLAKQLGVKGRLPAMLVGVVGLGLVVSGPDLIGLVPRAIAGGVLIGLGLRVMVTWITSSVGLMPPVDRFLSVGILAVIAVAGVLPGVGIGVLVAAMIFIVSNSRLTPVHHLMAAGGRSNVDRSIARSVAVRDGSMRIVSVELQGYLFFGSVMRLRQLVLAPFGSADEPGEGADRRWLILDFGRVVGIDSTAATGIATIAAKLRSQDTTVVFSSLSDEVSEALDLAGIPSASRHRDIDHAIEWCEDQLLSETGEWSGSTAGWEGPALAPEIEAILQARSVEAGQVLINVGDNNRDLYFIDSGTVTAWVGRPDGSIGAQSRRIRQVRRGGVLGEIAFVTGRPRSATVVADSAVTFRVLNRERFERLMVDDPTTAMRFQDYLLGALAARLQVTTEAMRERAPGRLS